MQAIKKACAFASVTFIATGAHATLQAYEPFNYTSGAALLTQLCGSGFSRAWVDTRGISAGAYTFAASSLAYTGLVASGRAANAPSSSFDTAARPFTLPSGNFGSVNGTTGYASFLIQPGTAAS